MDGVWMDGKFILGSTLLEKISMQRKRIADLERQLTEAQKVIAGLKDLAIWMTGCGYDFCQHPYFIKERDRLLKNENDNSLVEQIKGEQP